MLEQNLRGYKYILLDNKKIIIEDIIKSYFYSNYSILYYDENIDDIKTLNFKTFEIMKKWLEKNGIKTNRKKEKIKQILYSTKKDIQGKNKKIKITVSEEESL